MAWCQSTHRRNDQPGHAAQLGIWHVGQATIEVFAGHMPPNPPVVRIARFEDGVRIHVRDIDPALAAELAAILGVLPDDTRREFVNALWRAASTLDPAP
ncbi:hypothetical protein ACFQ0B_11805 [Nonomuraea thailandensis]|uniref:hypothetical protein n=1 Tax=Nonomuraea rubra TaxID=46180 RepID=UPI003611F8DB